LRFHLERHWDLAHGWPAVTPLKSIGKLLAFSRRTKNSIYRCHAGIGSVDNTQ
jgi:hypothetical protein